ncbi:MAG TPA: hypothetical protein VJT73_03275 [Polyangiaceae bacterium]|nr:hypothetical protein [Polyangiaceae bacterium]
MSLRYRAVFADFELEHDDGIAVSARRVGEHRSLELARRNDFGLSFCAGEVRG